VWCLQDWDGDEIEAPVQMDAAALRQWLALFSKLWLPLANPNHGYQMDEAAAAIGL
jgi:hypothetical protein